MKLAVITDNTAALSDDILDNENLFILDIPIVIDEVSYLENRTLTLEEFYLKMANSDDLPKTSQPSLAELNNLLKELSSNGYTHVIGLFLSSGISGFWQNIQFLVDEYPELEVAFPDSKITSAPLASMIRNVFDLQSEGVDFPLILEKLNYQIRHTTAFIMVNDLEHLVKGGRLSNGSAVIGNFLSIKPILRFNEEGKIVVYEKVRTEKKAIKRLIAILDEVTVDGDYEITIIHSLAEEKAMTFHQLLIEEGYLGKLDIVSFGAVIATHLGEGAVAFGITPLIS